MARVTTKTFTTKRGTELPLLDMGGKDYLPVASRVVIFREETQGGAILAEPINITDTSATFKATIAVWNPESKQREIISTGFAQVDKQDFPRFVERAETAAIGRALGYGGWGTLQCGDELDEGDQLSDAPINTTGKSYANSKNAQGKSVVRAPGGEALQLTAGATSTGSIEGASSVIRPNPVNSVASPSVPSSNGVSEAVASGLASQAKNRNDVNNLLSSVSRSLAAKRIMKVDDVKKHMRDTYQTDDKLKLSDEQATELLTYLDTRNNTIQAVATA